MYEGGLFIVPARAGSKRLPRKNLLMLPNGKNLIQSAVIAGRKAVGNGVLTTDIPAHEHCTRIGRMMYPESNVMLVNRDSNLCGDEVPSSDVVHDAIVKWETEHHKRIEFGVLLQPTSPLRNVTDIEAVINMHFRHTLAFGNDHVTASANPDGSFNGAVFVFDRTKFHLLGDMSKYVRVVSRYQPDVDTLADWDEAVEMMTR